MLDVIQSFPAQVLLAFVLAGLVLNLTPGADVLFAVASGLSGGPAVGAAAGVGVALGGLWHMGLAAAGIAALIAAHPQALAVLKWGGAAYLLYLGWSCWRAPLRSDAAKGAVTPRRALIRGFVTNALNPKVALFVLAFLPQFTDPARGPVWMQIVALGLIFTATGTLVTVGYGVLAGYGGRALGARMGVLNRVAGVVFVGLAARIVME